MHSMVVRASFVALDAFLMTSPGKAYKCQSGLILRVELPY
jgi:hypothetical protein